MPGAQQETDVAERAAAPVPGKPGLTVTRAPEPVRRAPRRRVWVLGVLLAGGAGLPLYLQPWATGVTPVPVEVAAMAPVTRVLATNGRIAARHSVEIRALVGGRIEAIGVAEGDEVQAGIELARVDAAAPQAALRQPLAGLDGALVSEARAQDTLARARALGANVSLTTLETAERAVQSAAQEVARTTALVDQAQVQLADYTLHAR